MSCRIPKNSPHYLPLVEDLWAMNKGQMNGLRLDAIAFQKANAPANLTFVFSNGVHSPPLGSYVSKPNTEAQIMSGYYIDRIAFGLHRNADNPTLLSVVITDKSENNVLSQPIEHKDAKDKINSF